jgi:hypothetical protein
MASMVEAAIEREMKNPALGVQVLVKGTFMQHVEGVEFLPSEVWLAQLPNGKPAGTFVQVFDNNFRCVDAPCPTFDEDKLNSNLMAVTEGFAFTSGVTSSLKTRMNEAAASTGVVVAGGRGYRAEFGGHAVLRYTNQVYLPVK